MPNIKLSTVTACVKTLLRNTTYLQTGQFDNTWMRMIINIFQKCCKIKTFCTIIKFYTTLYTVTYNVTIDENKAKICLEFSLAFRSSIATLIRVDKNDYRKNETFLGKLTKKFNRNQKIYPQVFKKYLQTKYKIDSHLGLAVIRKLQMRIVYFYPRT